MSCRITSTLGVASQPLRQHFHVGAGTVLGRDHARVGRNNQDGVAIRFSGDFLVAAVTDGCSAGRYSEVGARLGAAFLAERGMRTLRQSGRIDDDFAAMLTRALLRYLRQIVRGPLPTTSDLGSIVQDYLLFGFLCLVIDRDRALIFGIGDGVFSVDGDVTVLDPGSENAPRYLAYGLVPEAALIGKLSGLEPEVHVSISSRHVRSIVIGTDGIADLIDRCDEPLKSGERQGGLEQFEEEPVFVRNPSMLQKRLTVIGDINRRLRDDTTLVLVRRLGEDRPWTS